MSERAIAGDADFAFLLPSFRGGGAEISTIRLANQLSGAGYAVDVVVLQDEGPFRKRVSPAIPIYNLETPRALKAIGPIAAYLRRAHPKNLIANMSHINVVSVLARRRSNVPTGLMLVEHNDLLAGFEVAGSWKDRLLWLVMRFTYPAADWIAAVSRGAAESLEEALQLPAGSVHVLPNGIDIQAVQEEANLPAPHPWLDAGERVPVITSIGRLVPQKGYADLLKAFQLLRHSTDARLLIMGEGSLRPRLKALIEEFGLTDDVELPGFVDHPLRYVARSSLYVLSSLYEGQGVVLLEAMACGVPIVATDCPSGPSEVLSGGERGLLVPAGDPGQLAQAMRTLLEDGNARSQFRRKGLEAIEYYNIARSAERLVHIVLGPHTRRDN